MAVSLEVRAPFLDPGVVEHANALPSNRKFVPGNRKRILKHALRGKLPDGVLDRPKKGFGMPVARWLRGPLRETVDRLLGKPFLRRQGLFRPAAVRRLVDGHLSGRADERKRLWTLLVFQHWWERWLRSTESRG
jgi:asparagine synthase (glutamine-hydrolysing)